MVCHRPRFAIVLAATVMLAATQCARDPQSASTTDDPPPGLMSAAVETDGWRLDAEPMVYVGDSLFELINGGAELYHSVGFVQALAAEYVDADGRTIALEIFEMDGLQGAAKIYAEKTGGSGDSIAIGDEAAMESYYMNTRTGPYLITITGFESDEATTDGIRAIAEAVVLELGGNK